MLSALAALLFVSAAVAPADPPQDLASLVEAKRIQLSATGNGRDQITLRLSSAGDAKTEIALPAGLQFTSATGENQVSLRAVTVRVSPGHEADVVLPAAALASRNAGTQRDVTLQTAQEPKLAKVIELFAHQDDLPRPTAQLAIFVLLEDLDWPAWKQWLAPKWAAETPARTRPTPAEVAQAVDAIAFARLAAPEQKFAILQDDELKRLALRNPWARGKAMVLYGLSVEDAITGDPSLPVDLGKLLHTSANDNCAICRQRTKEPADIP